MTGISVNWLAPQYTAVDVTATITVYPDFDSATVIAEVEANVADFLDPSRRGLPLFGDDGRAWIK